MAQFPTVRFLLGAYNFSQLPEDSGREVAIAGRSNAGKSSAINAIVGRQGLARSSKTPGRTQEINFFELQLGQRLVDLPGYGFANVPVKLRQHWGEVLTKYFARRQSLVGVIVIMDARHPLTDADIQMLELAATRALPLHILLTKADKLTRSEANNTLATVRKQLADDIGVQLFSAVTKAGVEEAREVLEKWLRREADSG